MTIIYFYPFESQSLDGSGSAEVRSYYDNTQLLTGTPTTNVITYGDCLVAITGSTYVQSGSVDRINIYESSGSRRLLATYPIENTALIYPVSGGANSFAPEPQVLPEITYFGLDWSLTTSTSITSSLNQLTVYSGSTPATYSIYQTGSSGNGYISLELANTYSIHVSGGGTYYTTSLKIEDTYYGNTIVDLTASNANISYNLSESSNGIFTTYRLTATAESINNMLLDYSGSTIPVANSGSVDEWNSLLGIAAEKVELSGNSVYLLGSTLTNTGSLIISSSVSSSILNGGLKRLNMSGVTDLVSIQIVSGSPSGSLVEFPSLPGNSISSITIKYQNITGSAIDPAAYGNPVIVDCSHNQLSGSIPTFTTQSSVLAFYNCNNNALTGSIPNLAPLYNLIQFDCSNNKLTGSIPILSSSSALTYFDVSNNLLTGSVPYLLNNTLLNYIDYSNNQITDENGIYIKIINEVNIPQSVQYYDCSYNNLSGSLIISGSSNLVTFLANNNNFTTSLTENDGVLLGCTSLQTYNVGYNAITGSIPSFNSTPVLTTFIARNNKIDNISGSFTIPPTLTYFDLENNNLVSSSIDDIAEVFWTNFSGSAVTGTINLSGSGNAPVNEVTTLTYFNELTASGWTIYANNYP